MKNFRLFLIFSIFFFLKENAIAQPGDSFKKLSDTMRAAEVDSLRVQDKKTLKKDDDFQFLPSIGISAGIHDLGFKSSEFDLSSAINVFINFTLDKKEIFNLETAFYAFQFNDSAVQSRTAFSVTYLGLKIYATRKSTQFRPFVSAGIAGTTLYILPTLNANAGVEYTMTSSVSLFMAISTLSTNKDGTIYYIEEKKDRMTAAFLGIRYQL